MTVSPRIIGVERTVWFQYKVSASTLFSEASSYLPKPSCLCLEVEVVSVGCCTSDHYRCSIASLFTIRSGIVGVGESSGTNLFDYSGS